uniref:Cuticular protein n=1 Tax=Daphnia galeata TaxID=27404 RepID=A0A8J2RZ09_9CRUS|nr:unnamed protein product [Daphnia galeata]
MKAGITCLLVLAIAAQAQFYDGYYDGYYPYPGVNATTAYTRILPNDAVPAAYPIAFSYPSSPPPNTTQRTSSVSPASAATSIRDGFGNQIGSYANINPEGKEVRVSYTADSRGFRVLSNDLPVILVANFAPPVDTPDVAQAKAEHVATVPAAKFGVAPLAPVVALPAKVQDTPEVVAAKADFAV